MSLTLSQALSIVEKPDFVKTAAPVITDYSFDSREATYLSYITAVIKEASAEDLNHFKKLAKFWGIADECEKAATKLASAMATQPPDSWDYAIVQEYEGKPVRKYAAYDAESCVAAATAFYENRAAYPYAWRKEAATKLLAKSAKFSVSLPEYVDTYLHKAAGFGVPTSVSLENAYVARETACPKEHKEALNKMAHVIEQMIVEPFLRYDAEFVGKAIDVIDAFDTETGISKKAGVPLAEELIDDSGVEPKLRKAAGCSNVFIKLSNGAEINASEIPEDVLNALDSKLSKLGTSELVDVLPTLPRDDADLLVRLLA
jgi:hypothetical protein